MVDARTRVAGKRVIFAQRTGGAPLSALSSKMIKSLKENIGLVDDFTYYGPTGREYLEWTLA